VITSNDSGIYTCHDCGHTWQRRRRWLWWPVRFALARNPQSGRRWFHRHGIESYPDGIEQRTYAQVWHFGRLRVVFGRYRGDADA
jgi:hypothetical protein